MKGFSPVCISMCPLRLPAVVHEKVHSLQTWDFSPPVFWMFLEDEDIVESFEASLGWRTQWNCGCYSLLMFLMKIFLFASKRVSG